MSIQKIGYLCIFLGFLVGCDARTGGVKIQFQASAVGKMSDGKPVGTFENRQGWKVTLEKAHMLLGPVYLYEGKPRVDRWNWLRPWGVAYADPGHVTVDNRKILGELRDHYVLDLLKGESLALGKFSGVEGQVDAMELQLLPPGAANVAVGSVADVDGATFFALGSAEKDGKTKKFRMKLTVPDNGTMRTVAGIAAEIGLLASKVQSGQLEIQVYIDRLFASVDFDTLNEPSGDADRFSLTAENGGMLQGVRSRYSYHVVWR